MGRKIYADCLKNIEFMTKRNTHPRLSRAFFARDTLKVARELLGKTLVRKIGRKIFRARITETEAYCGPDDKASHAAKGRTLRTSPMFGLSGVLYVYLIYGMYHCLNIVTEREGYPAAVLIRGLVPVSKNLKSADLNGPGKLCRALAVDRELNGTDSITGNKLWIEDAPAVSSALVRNSGRIGVEYAGAWKRKPWRFFLEER